MDNETLRNKIKGIVGLIIAVFALYGVVKFVQWCCQ